MRNILAVVVALSLSVPVLFGAVPARACWDGELVTVGGVTYYGGRVGWDAGRARELATWMARMDALIGPGARLEVQWGYVSLEDGSGGSSDWEWDGRSLAALFREVAARSHATPAEIARARSLETELVTVQVAASRDHARAEALAARIGASGAGEHGIYETGGFPADNPTAHVVTETDERGMKVHRVMVGAFVDRAEARRVRDRMAEALGLEGRVRPL